MEKKLQRFIIKGMKQDSSISKADNEFSYKNVNVRITQNHDTSLFTITNEKGAKAVFEGIEGYVLGHSVINKKVVIFTTKTSSENTEDNPDTIYRIDFTTNELKILFRGNLNFHQEFPIETIASYETEELQKVYWIDGRNELRSLNIADSRLYEGSDIIEDYFSSSPKLKLEEDFRVEVISEGGSFPSGIIQYCYTYFNSYGTETPVIEVSPIHYLNYNNRGASPEEKVVKSFSITIENVDKSFEYIRLYSIQRTSLDSTPIVQKIEDKKIDINTSSVTFIDTNTTGSSIDPTELFYKGSHKVIPYTFTHKDNTLFIGNYYLDKSYLEEKDKEIIKEQLYSTIKEETYEAYSTPKDIKHYYSSYDKGQDKITGFFTGEVYYLGVQFQYDNGTYTDPIYLGYKESSLPNKYNEDKVHLSRFVFEITDAVKAIMSKYNLIRAVPLIQYGNSKRILAQGVVNPTVFNIGDRVSNSPYAQSSWFFRPIVGKEGLESPTGIYSGEMTPNFGNVEFRHHRLLPHALSRSAEFQCHHYTFKRPKERFDRAYGRSILGTTNINDINSQVKIDASKNLYGVDCSILSFNSPYLDRSSYDSNNKYKIDLIGAIEINKTSSTYKYIHTSGGAYVNKGRTRVGFARLTIESEDNMSSYSFNGVRRTLTNFTGAPLWRSYWARYRKKSLGLVRPEEIDYLFMIYPFHSSSPLSNCFTYENNKEDILKEKLLYTLKYSSSNIPFKSPVRLDVHSHSIFLDSQSKLGPLKLPDNSTIYYSNNSDKVLDATNYSYGYYSLYDRIKTINGKDKGQDYRSENSWAAANEETDDKHKYASSFPRVYRMSSNRAWDDPGSTLESKDHFALTGAYHSQGLYIWKDFKKWNEALFVTGSLKEYISSYGKDSSEASYVFYEIPQTLHFEGDSTLAQILLKSPTEVKLQSSPHIALALGYDGSADNNISLLPIYNSNSEDYYWSSKSPVLDIKFLDSNSNTEYKYRAVNIYNNMPGSTEAPILFLANIVSDNFMPDSEDLVNSRPWIIGGKGKKKGKVIIDRGDTYYQRWECIKTFPYEDTVNKIVEGLSFMLETRINLEGYYGKDLGLEDISFRQGDSDKINPIYSQHGNFFQFSSIKELAINKSGKFPTQVSWTKTKTIGSDTDYWKNLTLANTLDLDGDKGRLVRLIRHNNSIIFLQENGIGEILFNSRVQIPVNDGIPIEISNGYKVEGKRYISEYIGCQNKWSVCSSTSGLYFIDNNTNVLYQLSQGLKPISDILGFKTFIEDNYSSTPYFPSSSFHNFFLQYDDVRRDVYIIKDKDNTLVYNEVLGSFETFIDYENSTAMFNVDNKFYSIYKDKVWEHWAGDYSTLRDTQNYFSVEYRVNPDGVKDKIFTNLEFRGESFNNKISEDTEINTVRAYNEYQDTTKRLNTMLGNYNTLKRKFRIYRADIPRPSLLKRTRNTWLHLELKASSCTKRNTLHDLIVSYYE